MTRKNILSPIIAVAVAFMVGILLGYYLVLPSAAVIIAVGLSLAGLMLSLRQGLRRLPVVLVLIVWLGLGVLSYQVRYLQCPREDIVRYSSNEPVLVRVRGQVLDDAYWAASTRPWMSDPSLYFPIQVEEIFSGEVWIRSSGIVKVRVKRPFRSHVRGERLELLGMLGRYRGPANPGEFDWREYQRFQVRLCRLSVESGAAIGGLELPRGTRLSGLLDRFRQSLSSVLSDEDFSAESNSLLKTMVLGERDGAFRRLNEAFQKTGLFHFLCVSGLHLGVLAGFVWLCGLLLRLPRRGTALLVMTVVVFYAALVPARAPIVRASVVVCLLCLAEITARQTQRLHSLALAAMVVLLWRPAEMFNIGFQLSFIIVAALTVLCPRLTILLSGGLIVGWRTDPGMHPRPQVRHIGSYLWLWFVRLASTCLIAWFVCMPLIVYYFGWFNPWGPIYSLLLAPLAMATLISGYITTFLGSVFPVLAEGLRVVSLSLADWFYESATLLSRIPGIVQQLPAPPLLLLLGFYAWLILVAVRPSLRWRFERLRLARAWMIAGLLVLLAGYLWFSQPLGAGKTLALHLLSVGNGQVCIVELPNGAVLACDAGNMSGGGLSDRIIMPFLRSRNLRRIDALAISHPNWDHYSAASELIKSADIPTLMVSPYFAQKSNRKGLSRVLEAGADVVRVGGQGCLSGTGQSRVEILWPRGKTATHLSSNDASLVMRISYAGRSILLTGDISEVAQRLLLEANVDLRADVLIWPHHGAIVDSTASFFEAVNPEVVLVSCADDRAKRIQERSPPGLLNERRYYSTSHSGALSVLLSAGTVEVIPFIGRE